MLLSQFVPPAPSPAVSTRVFSMFEPLLLPWKWVNQYHFSRFHICIDIWYLFFFSFWLTSLRLTGSRFIHLRRTDSDLFLLAVPLLGIYPEKTIIKKDTCIAVFTAAWFPVAMTQKQSACPSAGGRIKKSWYIYTVEYGCTSWDVMNRESK